MNLHITDSVIPSKKQLGKLPGARLYWLGQAGFLLETADLRILIDAYLSDSLAVKYKGKEFPHIRMMPPPIAPDALFDIDYVLCTHGHTDHMDGETIRAVVKNNPKCMIVVPAAEKAKAEGHGIPPSALLPVNAGSVEDLSKNIRLKVLAAAHEQFKQDEQGQHFFLSYLIEMPGLVVYHGGDGIPYPDLARQLKAAKVDLTLLPVNGRSEYLTSRGIVGNFTLEEAVSLSKESGASYFIGHHFGLFEFNTIDRADGLARLNALCPEQKEKYVLVELGKVYEVKI